MSGRLFLPPMGHVSDQAKVIDLINEAAGDIAKFRELYKARFKSEPSILDEDKTRKARQRGVEFIEIGQTQD